MVKSDKNPGGLPIDMFDGIRAGVANDRSQFYKDLTLPFFGYNRSGAKISEGVRENFGIGECRVGSKVSTTASRLSRKPDFNEDLKKIDVPTLVMHGDDDQIVPFSDAGAFTAKIVKNATLKVYPGFPHGMPISHADVINPDLLAFIKAILFEPRVMDTALQWFTGFKSLRSPHLGPHTISSRHWRGLHRVYRALLQVFGRSALR